MQVIILDREPASRATMHGRAQLAARQAELRRIDLVDVELNSLSAINVSMVHGCLIGPGCYELIDQIIPRVRQFLPNIPIGLVLENEVYANQAVNLRRLLNIRVMPLGDLAQIASFLIDCESEMLRGDSGANRGVVGVAQLKGGVGATTVTAALASCWARHGLSVVAVDLDDLNPQLTDWGRVGSAQRTITADFLKQGEVSQARLNEMLSPVEGFDGKFVIVGQPESYNRSFHFKADVIENAPSSAEFMSSLIPLLRDEFDVVIVDLGRSWGVSTFATLPLCQEILLVTDDDGMSVRRTLDNLFRLKREASEASELDLNRWALVLNAYTGRLISPADLAQEIQDMELFPPETNLYSIPFSERGRQWGAPGQTLYELAEDNVRYVVRQLAANLVPFRYDASANQPKLERLMTKWKALIGRK